MWHDKREPHTTYMDSRYEVRDITSGGFTKKIRVQPDVIADFRHVPAPDCTFDLIVFDPPHLRVAGERSYMRAQYGVLPEDWERVLHDGFWELQRVLRPSGVLLFKWNSCQIPHKDVIRCFGVEPILGDQRSRTRWSVFLKAEGGGR